MAHKSTDFKLRLKMFTDFDYFNINEASSDSQ